jgi:hypothetical protein
VFGAFDPRGAITYIYRDTIKIRSTPCRWDIPFFIISRAFVPADRTKPLDPFVRSGMDMDPFLFKDFTVPPYIYGCFLILFDMH